MATIAETPESAEELRKRLNDVRIKEGRSWAVLATESGIPSGTLSPWASGTYTGDTLAIATRVRKYLDGRMEVQRLRAMQAINPGWVETKSARRMLSILQYAHGGEMVAIAAAPGVGKTFTATEYQTQASNVFIATMTPSSRSPREAATTVLLAIGEPEYRYGANCRAMSRQIVSRMRGANALIIIDEAQELEELALDEIRSWHDACGVGIALVGDERVIGRLGGLRRVELARLQSRISMRHLQRGPLAEDVEAVVRAWGIEDSACIKYLRGLATKPGALRGIVKTVKLAGVMAGSEARSARLEDLKAAWSQLNIDNLIAE